MQRQLLFMVAALGATLWTAGAQENPSLLADAQRQENEERYRRLNARLEDLEAANQAWQKRFHDLEQEVTRLRQELARATAGDKDTATQENLKNLAKSIEEVDAKRQADNEKVLAAFADLQKKILDRTAMPTKPKPATTPAGSRSASAGDETGYEYTVVSNDNLFKIVAKLNKQGVKITPKQVSDANPGVKWERLQIGQKLFIPAPK
jgi:LysM repeat protein